MILGKVVHFNISGLHKKGRFWWPAMLNLRGSSCASLIVDGGRDGYFSFERSHHLHMMLFQGEMGILSFERFCHSCLMLLVWGLFCGVFEIFSQGYNPFFITWKLDSKLHTRKFFELLSVSCRYFEIGTDCWRVDISATFSCAQCLPLLFMKFWALFSTYTAEVAIQ